MNVLEMLFPLRSRGFGQTITSHKRRHVRQRQQRVLEPAERLEQRLPLAVTPAGVDPTTPNTFFIDSGTGLDSEYTAYQITNDLTDPGPAVDVWVRATNFGAGTIGLAPHEDGIYQVGPLANGETGNAFLYFSASGPQAVPQSYDFEVWNGNPLTGGTQLFTETYTYVSVQDTLEAEPNKIESVTISPASPAVGDILTMTVVGRLGNGADRVLFAPATTGDWLADTFELRSTDITISGIPVTDDRLYYGTLPSPSVNQQPFTAVYSFLITGPAATATQTSPSQYTQDNGQNWKHHRPSSTPFPVIPPLVYELSLTKDDGQTTYAPGTSTTYTIELTNTGNASVSDVAVADMLPPQLAPTTTWFASYTDATGTLPTTPTMGDIAGTVSLDAFTGSVTITILADILSSATGDLSNTVTATAPGDAPLSATDTNSYAPIIDLTLDKTTVGPVVAGQTVIYQIAIGNLGPSDVTNAQVTDPFAGVLSGVTWAAVFTDGSGNTSGSGNIDELIDLAAGGSAVYSVTGLLASSATGNLVNTATVTSPEDTATDTVTDPISRDVDLTLDKVTTSPVVAGQLVTYQITVANLGDSDVFGAAVTDPFAGVLSGVSWTAVFTDGSGNTSGSGDINESIDLASGGSSVYSVTGLLASSATGSLVNTATVTSPEDTATDTVTDPIGRDVDLTLDKVTTSPVVAGQLVTYQISVANLGDSDVFAAAVTDPFAGVLSGVTWTAVFTDGTGNTSGSGNIDELIDLESGGSAVYTVTGLLASSATGSLVNTATVTSPEDTATDTVTDPIGRDVDLTLDKLTTSPVVAGQLVTYQISVANLGDSDVFAAAVTDPFAGVLSGVTWTAVFTDGSGNTSGAGNIDESIDLASGGTAVYSVTGLLASSATGSLVNTATVTSPEDTATDTVTDPISRDVDLTLDKVTTSPIVAGQLVTYQITVANVGDSDVFSATVTDPFAGVLSGVTWTVVFTDGSGNTSGSGDINESIDLASGGTAVYSMTGLLASSATGSLVNTATVTSPEDTATDTVTDPISRDVDLTLDKVTTSPVVAGQLVTYQITVANLGDSDVYGATVTDPFAGVLSGVSWTAVFTDGSGNTSGAGDINELIDLASGGTAVYSVTGLLASSATGSLANTATVTSPEDTATDTVTDPISRDVDLTLDKVTTSSVVAGQLVTYQITVANLGNSDVFGAAVTDPFAGVLSGVSWAAVFTDGSGNTSGSGDINELIDLASGGTAVYSVTGLLASSATGSLVNTATVTSPEDTATDTVTDPISRDVDLTLDKVTTSPVVAGQLVTYQITVANIGDSDVFAAAVTDPFAGVLSGVSWTAVFTDGSGNTSGSGDINELIDLAAGGTAVYSVTGLLASSATGSLINTATVTSPEDTATDTVTDTITRDVDLTLDKLTTSSVVAGQLVTYQITVANIGDSDVFAAAVTDPFAGVLSGVSWTAVFTDGSGNTSGSGDINELIDLASGGTAVYSVTGLLASSATGSLINTATVTSPEDTATDTVTDPISRDVDLTLDKVTTSPVVAGQLVTYQITVANLGGSDVFGASVTDPFAGVLSGVSWTAVFTDGSGNTSGSGDINELIDLAAGGSVVYSVTGLLASSATGSLINTATVTSPEDTATDTVTDPISRDVDLTLDKVTTSSVVAGQLVTYQVTVANVGDSDVFAASVTDPFVGLLSGVTWTAVFTDGSGNTSGLGDINELIDLAAGGSAVYSVTGLLASSATGSLINTATVTSPEDTATDTVTDPISRDVDLTLDKLTTSPVVASQLVTYQITVANIGDSDVFGAAVTDPFAGVLSAVTWTAVFTDGSGNTSGSGDINELIDLAAGGSAVYSVTGLLASSATGVLVNTATVTSPEDTATDTVTDQIVGEAILSISKTGDLTYKAGGFVNFTVVVTNNGPSFASNVNVFDALPANVVSWSWTVSYSPGSGPADGSPNSATDSTLPIDKNVDLAVLGTATFEISALTVEDQEEDVINDALASLGEQIVTARWISAYDGPINPTQDVGGLVIGSDDGCNGPPLVRILDPVTGDLISEFLAFEPSFTGSVRVASGDLTGDGIAEVVVANGRNRLGEIRVFTPAGVELTEYRTIPFVNGYSGGVEVAVADVDGDGFNDLIAGKSVGQGRVKIFRVDPTLPDPVIDDKYAGFYAYKYPYNAGTMVAGADIGTYVNGVKVSDALDGKAEIISLPNAGKRARVKIVDVTGKPTVVRTLFAFAKEFRGGGTVSVGEYDGDGVLDIFVGMGVGGQSTVDVFSGSSGAKLAKITAFSEFAKPQARVFAAALDLDEDGIIDDVFGVQGAAGGGGTNGVLDFDRVSDSASILPNSTFLEPPLRIAPIILRVPG